MKATFTPKLFINIGVLLLIFTASVFVRLDNLKDPMGRHHEWLTGHVLSTVSIFEKDGAKAHYYSPVWTFNTEADRYVISFQNFKDKNNFTYYVSYPPLCFLLPHFIFKITGTAASVIGLRIIGMLIQFLIGFFAFLIICTVFKKRITKDIFIPAFVAFFLYTFASGNLWFHGHVWFADMLVPLFIAAFLYIFLKVLNGDYSIKKSAVLLFAFCFLGSYTEWQMLFVAFFAGTYFFIKGFKEKKYFFLFLCIGLAAVIPVLLTYYQYGKIAGNDELIKVVSAKYEQRSGTSAAAEGGMNMANSFSYENISNHYEINYSTLLDFAWICLILFTIIFAINKLRKEKLDIVNPSPVFVILFLSVILHHLLFFNFTTVHDFSTLKIALPLSLFSAYAIATLFVRIGNNSKIISYISYAAVFIGLGLFYHVSVSKYYRANHISTLFKSHAMVGEIISKYVQPNEIVITNAHTSPETTWYAKRNIIEAGSFNEALSVLTRINSTKNGAYVVLNELDFEILKFNTRGDTLSRIKEPLSKLSIK